MIEQWNLDITKGPKDWQNVFAIPTARSRYIKVLFHSYILLLLG